MLVSEVLKTGQYYTSERLRWFIRKPYKKHNLSKYLYTLYMNDLLERKEARTIYFSDHINRFRQYKGKYAYRIPPKIIIEHKQLEMGI